MMKSAPAGGRQAGVLVHPAAGGRLVKHKVRWLFAVVVPLVAIGGLAWARRSTGAVEVQVAVVGCQDLQAMVSANGRVQAQKKVDVSATIAGQITHLAVQEGEQVRKGQLLLQIDP